MYIQVMRRSKPKIDTSLLARIQVIFDATWYLNEYRDVSRVKFDALEHYLTFGIFENRSPCQWFDARFYAMTNPDVVKANVPCLIHYLKSGYVESREPSQGFDSKGMHASGRIRDLSLSPLENYIQFGIPAGENPGFNWDEVWPQVRGIAYLEPQLILLDKARADQIKWGDSIEATEEAKVTGELQKKILTTGKNYDLSSIVFLPHFVYGGADKYALNLLEALREINGRYPITVLTDSGIIDAHSWIPDGVELYSIQDLNPDLGLDNRSKVIRSLIYTLEIKNVFGINSHALYRSLELFGDGLSSSSNVFVTQFSHDYNESGQGVGYAAGFTREVLNHVKRIISDNTKFPARLKREFSIPDSIFGRKYVTVFSPVNAIKDGKTWSPESLKKRKILWIGRAANEKNIPLLVAICEHLPDVDFYVYGSGDFNKHLNRNPSNLHLKGQFESLADISPEAYSAFLYTSRWDGLPVALLEMGALGMPVVATNVGGISDLIFEETGWLCESADSHIEYINAINAIIESPELTVKKSQNLKELVHSRHSFENFVDQISELLKTE